MKTVETAPEDDNDKTCLEHQTHMLNSISKELSEQNGSGSK
jgi:hypothetical protein